ncbi:hypothetical protein QBC37DRAFT_401279 [Rhypophila decipiens]|uniref:Uncharacterized protein n=1 Tax=Rhypophila decipiens TaxID=261697 RepID=A0AAN6Y6C9_9PEZI|nr:hypothetical protein QBC37DRAFT_401279 [Rhypophila decipiens]
MASESMTVAAMQLAAAPFNQPDEISTGYVGLTMPQHQFGPLGEYRSVSDTDNYQRELAMANPSNKRSCPAVVGILSGTDCRTNWRQQSLTTSGQHTCPLCRVPVIEKTCLLHSRWWTIRDVEFEGRYCENFEKGLQTIRKCLACKSWRERLQPPSDAIIVQVQYMIFLRVICQAGEAGEREAREVLDRLSTLPRELVLHDCEMGFGKSSGIFWKTE